MVGSVLGAVVVLAVAVVVALTSQSQSSANGCVFVNLPYSTGGAQFYACGTRARAMCTAVGTPGAFTGAAGDAVAVQCRKAGLRVGEPGR